MLGSTGLIELFEKFSSPPIHSFSNFPATLNPDRDSTFPAPPWRAPLTQHTPDRPQAMALASQAGSYSQKEIADAFCVRHAV
jgi:hypothetical protein